MPQGDVLTFGPTVLVVGLSFLAGYYQWITWSWPRLAGVFRSRSWLSVVLLVEPAGWPELFLIVVQFVGLVYLITQLELRPTRSGLVIYPSQVTISIAPFGRTCLPVDWIDIRESYLWQTSASTLQTWVVSILQSVVVPHVYFDQNKRLAESMNDAMTRIPSLAT